MNTKRLGLIGAALTGVAALAVASVTAHPGEDHEHAEVGHEAPDFTLVDLNGDEHTLGDYTEDGKIVVLEWFNPKCPFVVKHHDTHTTMADTFAAFEEDEVVWLAINSAKEGHATGDLDMNREYAEEWEIGYPILIDQSGEVGKTYGAKTTPHMYVIDAEGVLVYAGAIDSDRSPKELGETNYVYEALTALKNGETIEVAETKPYGCSVKY